MAGALAERVFVEKIAGVGFDDVQVLERERFSLADVTAYPLFTPDLVELAHKLLTPEQQRDFATRVTVTARKPARAGA